MSILHRIIGSRQGDAYSEGIALFEQGRHTEAVARLREAGGLTDQSPRGSLAAFYLHKALVAEGRRLLAAGEPQRAERELRDAVQAWPDYPDLHVLYGTAAGLKGDWSLALTGAQEALRRNPDYVEARLVEACALRKLGRPREAASSLNALLEAGRRVTHPLVDGLRRDGGYQPDSVPADLVDRLREVVGAGSGIKDRLAQAIASCQAGEWESGLTQFARLAKEQPRFPDIRARHAAALFQVGRLDDALTEVDAALAVNPQYRTAVTLRGLILADQGDLAAARRFLADALPSLQGAPGRHEEIFLAYLRGALAFLLGDVRECRELLDDWEDLPHQFARAALLLAACDDIEGLPDRCAGRLGELAEIWSADADLTFFLAAEMVRSGQLDQAERALTHWPGGGTTTSDLRPSLLRARVAVARGRAPAVPRPLPSPQSPDQPRTAAWRQLAAVEALSGGDAATTLEICQGLIADGTADEETGRLWLQAARERPGSERTSPPPPPVPDSWLPSLCWWHRGEGRGHEAEHLLGCRRAVRPDDPRWWWLSAIFWLGPVRRWIS
jgi:tetratricopeptide (TPR) repeat protein